MDREKHSLEETGYGGALFFSWLGASGVTILFGGFAEVISLPNIVLVFLLVTFLLALKLGRKAGLISAALNVAYFDFFFVPPRLSFNVEDSQYLITFLVMLIVGLLTGHLVAKLRERIKEIQKRQAFLGGLQEFAQRLLMQSSVAEITHLAETKIAQILDVKMGVYIGNETAVSLGAEAYINPEVKNWCFQSGTKIDDELETSKPVSVTYQPIKHNLEILGILIAIDQETPLGTFGKSEILTMAANLIAMAIIRLQMQEKEQSANFLIEKEKLKNVILSSLSHDIRTPLTAMIANADNLIDDGKWNETETKAGLVQIRDQGLKLSQLIGDLIELSKLQISAPILNKSLQPVEEVIGSSIAHFKLSHPARRVIVSIDQDAEAIAFDDVLIERVICNLMENSAKASPEDTPIVINAKTNDNALEISIIDSGAGLSEPDTTPSDQDKRQGLGLIIVKTILEAHGGTLSLANREDADGAIATFTLPK